jgi:hypothetical protein
VIAETHEGLRGNLLAPISINEHGYEACGSDYNCDEELVFFCFEQ